MRSRNSQFNPKKPRVLFHMHPENYIRVGQRAYVFPIDHPDTTRVSNECFTFTSEVIKVFPDGSFETKNTLYVPYQKHFF